MKKRNLKNLQLNKIAISSLKGGALPEEPSEAKPVSLHVENCSPVSLIPNTDCTCA